MLKQNVYVIQAEPKIKGRFFISIYNNNKTDRLIKTSLRRQNQRM